MHSSPKDSNSVHIQIERSPPQLFCLVLTGRGLACRPGQPERARAPSLRAAAAPTPGDDAGQESAAETDAEPAAGIGEEGPAAVLCVARHRPDRAQLLAGHTSADGLQHHEPEDRGQPVSHAEGLRGEFEHHFYCSRAVISIKRNWSITFYLKCFCNITSTYRFV